LDTALEFLHSTLDEETIMFIRQPPLSDGSYIFPGKFHRVIRSMYEARQISYIFTIKLAETLIGWSYRWVVIDILCRDNKVEGL
jgi:hypothetical protein